MTLRWGICGTGSICNDFCAALQTLPPGENEIVAVASRSQETADAFAAKMGIKFAYDSYDKLADNRDIDVVYIGVLNNIHVQLSKQMLNSGHHVLCEKPMAINTEQVKEVFHTAKKKNKFFMEALWSRCFPIYEDIARELQTNSLGTIQLVTATLCLPIINFLTWLPNRSLGGGCLLNLGIYPIQFANLVFNNEKPQKITAFGNLAEDGLDTDGTLVLTYKNGARAVVNYSITTGANTKSNAVIYGTEGRIDLPDTFFAPVEASLPSGDLSKELPEGPMPLIYPNSCGLRYEADHVRKCIQAGKIESDKMSHTDSEMVYYIMDEARRQIGVSYDCEY